jgi:hypothetical protein
MRNVRVGKYTSVLATDEPGAGNARHEYQVVPTGCNAGAKLGDVCAVVSFQNGPILEKGVNGVMNEDLLAIVIDRLEGFQSGDYKCRENAIALTKCQEALMWLEKRTFDREARGVEGKSVV